MVSDLLLIAGGRNLFSPYVQDIDDENMGMEKERAFLVTTVSGARIYMCGDYSPSLVYIDFTLENVQF